MIRFVNTRKRFLTPIITEIQRRYGNERLDMIKTKRDLYNLLRELSRDGNGTNYSLQWVTSFLAETNCWMDDIS